MSSGSSLGSLTSTGSQGSQSSVAASLSDIYIDPCQQLTYYDTSDIDRDALFQRIERLLKCSEEDRTMTSEYYLTRTAVSQEVPPTSEYNRSGILLPTAVMQEASSSSEYNHSRLRTNVFQEVPPALEYNQGIVLSQTASLQQPISCVSEALPSEAVTGLGCLPTYEEHLELQKCRNVPTVQADAAVGSSDSLQALSLGPFTRRLIASSSADHCLLPLAETFVTTNDVRSDSNLQWSLVDVGSTQTVGHSDASSGVSGVSSRHVSTGSATGSDSGICEASRQQ